MSSFFYSKWEDRVVFLGLEFPVMLFLSNGAALVNCPSDLGLKISWIVRLQSEPFQIKLADAFGLDTVVLHWCLFASRMSARARPQLPRYL